MARRVMGMQRPERKPTPARVNLEYVVDGQCHASQLQPSRPLLNTSLARSSEKTLFVYSYHILRQKLAAHGMLNPLFGEAANRG